MKTLLLALTLLALFTIPAFSQNTEQLLGEVAQLYTGANPSDNTLIAGFSLAGLIGGCLFGGIGFIAFMYGKGNAELKPLIIGLLLMAYPCFVKDTTGIYVTGAVLTAALYFWRD